MDGTGINDPRIAGAFRREPRRSHTALVACVLLPSSYFEDPRAALCWRIREVCERQQIQWNWLLSRLRVSNDEEWKD